MQGITSGQERYQDWSWRYYDMSAEGMIAASAEVVNQEGEYERHMLLLIPFTTHEIREDGTLAAGGGVQASFPSPVFDMNCALENLRVQADGSIFGDLKIGGSLTSKACDNVKGEKGSITQGQLWVNGADEPHSVFTIQASKAAAGTRERPYPYTGTIPHNTVIPNVPLTAGVNTFKFTAHDPVYFMPGYSTWAATITVTDPTDEESGGGSITGGNPGGSFSLSVQLPAATLSPASADTVLATMNLDGTAHAGVPLTETAAASSVFTGTLPDGRPARLTLTGTGGLSAEAVDTVNATLLLGAAGAGVSYGLGLRESAAASGVFVGGYEASTIAATGGAGGGASGGGATGSSTTNTGGSTGGGGGAEPGGGNNTNPSGGAEISISVSTDPYEGMEEVEKSNGG